MILVREDTQRTASLARRHEYLMLSRPWYDIRNKWVRCPCISDGSEIEKRKGDRQHSMKTLQASKFTKQTRNPSAASWSPSSRARITVPQHRFKVLRNDL